MEKKIIRAPLGRGPPESNLSARLDGPWQHRYTHPVGRGNGSAPRGPHGARPADPPPPTITSPRGATAVKLVTGTTCDQYLPNVLERLRRNGRLAGVLRCAAAHLPDA